MSENRFVLTRENFRCAFHPGETLREALEEKEMSVKEFAVRADKPEKTVAAVLAGRSSVTPDMAVAFENVLGIPMSYWLNAQASYDGFRARQRKEEKLRESGEWLRNFPMEEIRRLGWIGSMKETGIEEGDFYTFLGVSSRKAWKEYYIDRKLKVSFSCSLEGASDPYALSVWLRKGEVDAWKLETLQKFSRKRLKSSLLELRKTVRTPSGDLFSSVRDFLLRVGVRTVLTPCLESCRINGAVRWMGQTPLIQLSDLCMDSGLFEFTLFHEIGHILLHGKKSVFMEEKTFIDADREREEEASMFAAQMLLSAAEDPGSVAEALSVRFRSALETY